MICVLMCFEAASWRHHRPRRTVNVNVHVNFDVNIDGNSESDSNGDTCVNALPAAAA